MSSTSRLSLEKISYKFTLTSTSEEKCRDVELKYVKTKNVGTTVMIC